jgi:hypothetical protein
MPNSHHVRKVIKVGDSFAVVIPPHILELMKADLGDYLVMDTSAPPFVVLSKAPVPPYVTNPERFDLGPTLPT